MKNIVISTFGLLFFAACTPPEPDMKVIVSVKELKKGTLFLEKVLDSLLVIIDSAQVAREEAVTLTADLDHAELFYLTLNKNGANDEDNRIPFFGDYGTIEINTLLDRFATEAVVKGSDTHDLYNSYMRIVKRFNEEELDLIAQYFQFQKNNNPDSLALLEEQSSQLTKRKILFTVNFAVNNGQSVLAPYLALTELNDIQPSLLDTIAKSMTLEVASTKYGSLLSEYVGELTKQ
ncbi:MAG: DUF4369 domain-containing protein [Flavobacteriaceae bacterium]|jgi:hypothetical protein